MFQVMAIEVGGNGRSFEEIDGLLSDIEGVGKVHAQYYLLATELHKTEGDHANYYRYVHYVDVGTAGQNNHNFTIQDCFEIPGLLRTIRLEQGGTTKPRFPPVLSSITWQRRLQLW